MIEPGSTAGTSGGASLVAEDAIVAGHLVLQKSPDLILADIEMPFMNGLEFVQALRVDPSVSHTPVIFVSSRDDLEDLAKSFGAVAFLKKPVHADQLLAAVAQQSKSRGHRPPCRVKILQRRVYLR